MTLWIAPCWAPLLYTQNLCATATGDVGQSSGFQYIMKINFELTLIYSLLPKLGATWTLFKTQSIRQEYSQ